MVAEIPFKGVGMQVVLSRQVLLLVFADIMIEQGDRHAQRHRAISVLIDNFEQLLLFCGRELFFKVP